MTDMVHCRGCGKEIHRTAVSCPQCGAVQRAARYKSKTAAGVLAIFLGVFGVHRFYLGQWWGIFYVLLFWTWIPSVIALVEGIVFLLTNQETWDQKYNDGIPGEMSSAGVIIVALAAAFFGVAAIGILAAIAIPAYQDYTLRAQVIQSITDTAPIRQVVADALASGGSVPVQAVDELRGEVEREAQYLERVQVTEDGYVVLAFGRAGTAIGGRTIVFEPVLDGSEVAWSCSRGDLEAKYRPQACRQ